ncbi:hypothetical protein M5E87_04275 [Flavonifractor plautii]|nr:hypothetical protein M5E87_04275 [Flavonifractor plautii]
MPTRGRCWPPARWRSRCAPPRPCWPRRRRERSGTGTTWAGTVWTRRPGPSGWTSCWSRRRGCGPTPTPSWSSESAAPTRRPGPPSRPCGRRGPRHSVGGQHHLRLRDGPHSAGAGRISIHLHRLHRQEL